ncbi:MAG: ABC transporter ATP-binding protein [Planctomycetota bacterium]|nr:MAG: ABC transporter ATP-binding protein [Planctomycetota bacterium]
MTAVIETFELVKDFSRRRAVDNLSITVRQGDIYGFLGPNGSGKSTTMRMVLGLITPTAGRVSLFGKDTSAHLTSALARTGALIEEPAFYNHLSGRRNLKLYQAYGGTKNTWKIDEMLKLVGLSDRANDRVGTYSHGMRKRLAIAAALVDSPELVLLDEPSTGLDPQGMKEVRDLIIRLSEELGVTVFLSSHLLAEVEQVATRVGILKEGRLLYEGKPGGLLPKAKTSKFHLKVDNTDRAIAAISLANLTAKKVERQEMLEIDIDPERIGEINRILVEYEIGVMGITEVAHTLEDIFLSLTAEDK